MLPEKYLEDVESSARRQRSIEYIGVTAAFLASFLALGPIIHEIGHIAVLEFYRCAYYFEPGFSILRGMHATVEPLCSPGTARLILFYSIGYLSTVIVGGALSITAMTRKFRGSRYLAALGSGMLMSILVSISSEGDIQSALNTIGADPAYGPAIIAFIVLGVFTSSLKTMEVFTESERKE